MRKQAVAERQLAADRAAAFVDARNLALEFAGMNTVSSSAPQYGGRTPTSASAGSCVFHIPEPTGLIQDLVSKWACGLQLAQTSSGSASVHEPSLRESWRVGRKWCQPDFFLVDQWCRSSASGTVHTFHSACAQDHGHSPRRRHRFPIAPRTSLSPSRYLCSCHALYPKGVLGISLAFDASGGKSRERRRTLASAEHVGRARVESAG